MKYRFFFVTLQKQRYKKQPFKNPDRWAKRKDL